MATDSFDPIAALIGDAIRARVTPSAVIEVGRRSGPTWRHGVGRLTYDADATPATVDTVYDLASLTKVVATTSLVMRAVERRQLELDAPVSAYLPAWRGQDRSGVTLADLLEHASGLTAHLPFFRDHQGRAEFEAAICTLPLEYAPRSRSIYSDLGFILLGFILADAGATPLDQQWATLARDLGLGSLQYRPPRAWAPRIAPTEVDAWRGRLLTGEVHDENGWALDGVAGHTGLFGTVDAVGRFARAVLITTDETTPLGHPDMARRFRAKSTVPGSSRALGWDTMLTTSSCGHQLSASAIGHTGFTGTSLWIDPERDLYVVLLTNRVHPTRANEAILDLRPRVHDAVVQLLGSLD